MISLNWPVHLPLDPFFGRQKVQVTQIAKQSPAAVADERRRLVVEKHAAKGRTVATAPDIEPGRIPVADEVVLINPQSGSQWDCFRVSAVPQTRCPAYRAHYVVAAAGAHASTHPTSSPPSLGPLARQSSTTGTTTSTSTTRASRAP